MAEAVDERVTVVRVKRRREDPATPSLILEAASTSRGRKDARLDEMLLRMSLLQEGAGAEAQAEADKPRQRFFLAATRPATWFEKQSAGELVQFVAGLKPAAWEQAQAPRSTIELQAPTPQPRHAKQQTLMAIPGALKARQRGVHKAAVAAARYKQVRRKREEALSALDQAAYVYDLEVHHKQQKDEQAQAQAQAQRTQAQVQQQRAASIVEMVQGADGGVARRVAQQGGAAAEALAAQVYAPMVEEYLQSLGISVAASTAAAGGSGDGVSASGSAPPCPRPRPSVRPRKGVAGEQPGMQPAADKGIKGSGMAGTTGAEAQPVQAGPALSAAAADTSNQPADCSVPAAAAAAGAGVTGSTGPAPMQVEADDSDDSEYVYDVYIATADVPLAGGADALGCAPPGTSSLDPDDDGVPVVAVADNDDIFYWEGVDGEAGSGADSEDSNAEDYYGNDYPDEDDVLYSDEEGDEEDEERFKYMHPARGHQHYNHVNPDGMCSSSDEDDEIASDGRVMPKRAAATLQECNKPAGSDKRDAALANKMRKGCYRSAEDDYSEHSSFLDESDGDESERRDAQERQQRGIFHH